MKFTHNVGLGDVVKYGLGKLGIKQKAGCKCPERQAMLNRWTPGYRPKGPGFDIIKTPAKGYRLLYSSTGKRSPMSVGWLYGIAGGLDHTAASCSASDVQTQMNAATEVGARVIVPACADTVWSSTVSWTAPQDAVLMGQGSDTNDQTNIVDHLVRDPDNPILAITTNASGGFRMTGFRFTNSGGSDTFQGSVRFSGSTQGLRIDHNHFYFVSKVGMSILSQMYGVIDHNLIEQGDNNWNFTKVRQGNWGGQSEGNGSWADDSTLGSNRFIFFENNTLHNGIFDDCDGGGRYVIRYNIIDVGGSHQSHGTGHAGDDRGCRAWETYQNTWACNTAGTCDQAHPAFTVGFVTAGSGVTWGNTGPSGQNIANYMAFLRLIVNRANNATYSQAATPTGWGYCGTAFNGTGSNWDENVDAGTGRACLDQPGRGRGDLLVGQFPNKTNDALGGITWPRQNLEPTYEWLNRWTAVPQEQFSVFLAVDGPSLAENRDYYLYTPSFNGTVGVGSGSLSARPGTCTPRVAYWATDEQKLYQCSSANTWTLYYQPYTYPHPLVGGGPTPPAAPTGLHLI
jgi:hypothetical protein